MKSLIIVIYTVLFSASAVASIKTIEIAGYEFEYELEGSGNTTLFLEAGGSAGLQDWDPIYQELTKHTKVLRYSRLGNGNSSPIKKNYSSGEYAQEALQLLDSLNINEKVVYIAHSYGAYIARIFAAKYPHRVSGLMLIEPASEHDVDIMRSINLEKAEKEIAQVKLDDMKNGMSNQYLDFWAKRPLPDYPDIGDIPVTVIASIKTYEDPPLLFFTDKARQLWGELHKEWAESFPQGKAVLTDKSYHFPQNDEPEMVISEIIELLDRVETKVQHEDNSVLLKYSDFGPAAMSESLLGQSWWQWQQHGDSRPTDYDIKVVVYKTKEIKDIESLYPVVPEQQKDYRYVSYQDSINYLNKHIEEAISPQNMETLKKTKQLILEHF